jgi:hypothetical protein
VHRRCLELAYDPAMRSFSLLVLGVALTGCPWLDGPENTGPPCQDDVNACGADGGEFIEDPTCELTGELELALGQGEDSYAPLAAGEMPEIFNGSQGGQHVWMGVRVMNPDLERPSLKINITLRDCEVDCENPANWPIDNSRELVIDERTIDVTEQGWFEQASILVILGDWSLATHRRVEMLVTDPCGRQGFAVTED